jgi:hypothetical protein
VEQTEPVMETSTSINETLEQVEPVKEIWTARHDGEIGGFDYARAIAIDSYPAGYCFVYSREGLV